MTGMIDSLPQSITDVAESVSALAHHLDERFGEINEELGPLPSQVSNHDRIKFLEDRLQKLAKA